MRLNRRSIVGVGSDISNILVNSNDERIRYGVFALGSRILSLLTVGGVSHTHKSAAKTFDMTCAEISGCMPSPAITGRGHDPGLITLFLLLFTIINSRRRNYDLKITSISTLVSIRKDDEIVK